MLVCISDGWGGQEMVVLEWALRMRKNGLKVTTCCLKNSTLQKKMQEADLETIGLSPKYKYFSPKTWWTLRSYIARNEIATVMVHQLSDLWHVVPALFGNLKVQLAGVSHTFIGISKKDLLHAWLYRRLKHLIVLTESHRQNVLKYLPVDDLQIRILPNSIDTARFRPCLRNHELRQKFLKQQNSLLVGVVSRLDAAKGLQEVIEAAKLLKLWNLPLQIIIFGEETVGQPGMKARLQEQIEIHQLNNQVCLAGFCREIEVAMASMDILLMPSPAETFGRVLIEAMACELPVIACRGGGVADIITHDSTGLLVKPGDHQAMALAIRDLYEHPDHRQKLAANGLQLAKNKYDDRHVDQKLYSLFELNSATWSAEEVPAFRPRPV